MLLAVSFRHRSRRAATVTVAVLGGLVLLSAMLFFTAAPPTDSLSGNPVLQRLQRFREIRKYSPGTSLVDRRELQWQQAIAMWKDYPFAGIGLGAFPTELPNYNRDALIETPIDNAPKRSIIHDRQRRG